MYLDVYNINFFRVAKTKNAYHFYTEPFGMKMKFHSTEPFVTVLLPSEEIHFDFDPQMNDSHCNDAIAYPNLYGKDKLTNCIHIPGNFSIITKNSNLDEWTRVSEYFPNIDIAKTIISLDMNPSNDVNTNVVIDALPIFGILQPIPKNPNYSIYAGSLVIMDYFDRIISEFVNESYTRMTGKHDISIQMRSNCISYMVYQLSSPIRMESFTSNDMKFSEFGLNVQYIRWPITEELYKFQGLPKIVNQSIQIYDIEKSVFKAMAKRKGYNIYPIKTFSKKCI